MNYRHLFVLSYGRTGSTAIVAVLNGIAGTLIRGENADVVGHLMKIADELRPHTSLEPTTPSNPWFGSENFAEANLIPAFRRLVDDLILGPSPPPDLNCYGFKEVRYGLSDVEAKIAFLDKLYPGAGFIFSVRDSERVSQSEFQRIVPRNELDALHRKFSQLAERPRSFLVRHEDLVGHADRLLSDLFDFLGEPYDPVATKAILAERHSVRSTSPDSLWSDFPFFVRPGVKPTGVAMLYVNRFERTPNSVLVGGFVRADGAQRLENLRERGGKRLRQMTQGGEMRGEHGTRLPVINFLIKVECPPATEELAVLLPDGETFLEMSNLGTAAAPSRAH